ncbi:hypothetical protein MASR2M64_01150 [Candidatus Cloacimonadota bacterium]|nr:ATP-binding protein [Candidatus Cloacimonadota bacterium]
MFTDLKGDENDYMVSWDKNQPTIHSLYIEEIKGKTVAQMNSQYPYRAVKTINDPRDNGRWLFSSCNDQKNVYLEAAKFDWQIPLKREVKSFEAIPRKDSLMDNPKIEYYAVIVPQILDDIDSDGRMELVCIGADGFTANPRGMIVYDLETGKIKWRFDTAGNISSVLFQDFDLDGKKELVFGTYAFKNTMQEINGLDDTSGWIVVLSSTGKLLYKERQFSGYGQVNLDVSDREQDGKLEIYAINTTWGNEVTQNLVTAFNWNGNHLQRKLNLEMASSLEGSQLSDYITSMDIEGTRRLHLVDKVKGLIVLDDNLRIVKHRYSEFVKTIWAIEDLDLDGNKEIVLQTDDDYIEVLDNHYRPLARIKNPSPDSNLLSVNVVRTGHETAPLIGISSPREICYYQCQRLPIHWYLLKLYVGFAVYINLLLLLIVGFLVIRYRQRFKVMTLTASHLGEGFIVLNSNRRILFRNQVVLQLAKDSSDPKCKNLELCFPSLYRCLGDFIAGGKNIDKLKQKLNNGDDGGNYHITLFKALNPKTMYFITIYPDQIEGVRVKEQLEWAELARRLSHHVRRHITNIILSLDALNKDEDKERKEYYQIIVSEIEKVRVFTHAFQRFTELKDYDLVQHDVIPLIQQCLARIVIPQEIKLIQSWNGDSISAFVEPVRFTEAIENMLTNSIQAMPAGGTLHITVKSFSKATSPQDGLTVLVEIEDSGCGIPAKYMDDIWKPFFTTNQSGTGIGIPESKKIINSMSGLMHIQSEEKVGTTVSFWLKGEK